LTIKLLLVEDDQGDRQGFEQSVARFNHENGTEFEVVSYGTMDETLDALDSSFDCAVIDMKLGDAGGEGNEILKALNEANVRMPVVILTGTPGEADEGFVHIEVLKKGEADHLEILEDFRQVHDSGLTKVMGGRGLLEQSLSRVFKSNLLSQKEAWKRYGQEDPKKSEKALMRHVMNHLISMVDMDEESCVPEEFYIHPPVDDTTRTGSVVQSKQNEDYYAVLTPLCDLTTRANGEINARKLMLCRIASFEDCVSELPPAKQNNKGRSALSDNLERNNKGSYHFLPKTEFFKGGYLDFEALTSVPKAKFPEQFSDPVLQISPAFIKDIIARFSSHFGRQGQPTLTFAD
jgi:ActR/RegA family two-component response regulator